MVNTERTIIEVPNDISTIQSAIDAAPERNRIYVHSGIYEENLTITKPVEIFVAGSMERFVVLKPSSDKPAISVEDAGHVQIHNLHIFPPLDHVVKYPGIVVRGKSFLNLVAVQLTDFSPAIKLESGTSAHIEYCKIQLISNPYDVDSVDGIWAEWAKMKLENSEIYIVTDFDSSTGIRSIRSEIQVLENRISVFQNQVNFNCGLNLSESTGLIHRNDIFCDNAEGIFVAGSKDVKITDNVIVSSTGKQIDIASSAVEMDGNQLVQKKGIRWGYR